VKDDNERINLEGPRMGANLATLGVTMKIEIGAMFGESTTVSVGDEVGFKDDVEQSGKIIEIKECQTGFMLVLENEWGFEGEWLEGKTVTTIHAGECWPA
jgi:hypothetical protein